MPELIKHKRFIPYLFSRLKTTTIYGVWNRSMTYLRRFLLLGRIIKWLSIAVTVIETSAALLLIAAAALILLPAVIVVLIILSVAEFAVSTRLLRSREFRRYLEKDRIIVISKAGSFGASMAREFADKNSAVFIITANPKDKFISAEYKDGIYFIRHAFFFRLKRKKLSRSNKKLIYLM